MVIGVAVFDRAVEAFDPRKDPIVRVEAGRLREKLARHYEAEGAAESLVIEIPVGRYQARFVARARPAVDPRSAIAVMPLEHLGTRPDDERFCLGLAAQLVDTLSRAPGLRVAAAHSTIQARAEGMPLAKIGRTFGVAYVLAGSLQRSGDRVRCLVNLCRARDERYLWSQRFERADADAAGPFDFQDAIAAAATAAVSRIDSADRSMRAVVAQVPSTTSNAEARDLFEQARDLARTRTLESCEQAIAALERAVALDPRFARAHGELGLVNFSLAGLHSEQPARNLLAARQAATRALSLDPADGEALSLLAAITFRIDRDWPAAESMFVDALRLNPHAPSIHMGFATCLVYNGRFDEALAHARIARRNDPLNIGMRGVAASITCFAGLYDQAIAEQREVLAIAPDHLFSLVNLAVAAMAIEDYDAADRALGHACALAPEQPGPRLYRIACLGLRGRRDEAATRIAEELLRIGDRPYSRVMLATAQSAAGRVDAMYRSLDEGARAHDLLYVALPVHPLFHARRDDVRFADQLRRTGLKAVVERP